jgi:hypothetical protein
MENHGEFISIGKHLIRPPELSGNDTGSHIVATQEERAKEMKNLTHKILLSHSELLITCCNILRHGTDDFTSPAKEVVLRIFIALKTSSPSAGSEPAPIYF